MSNSNIIYDLQPIEKFSKKRCGIYKLIFGEKYYLGRSINIETRCIAHKFMLAKLVSDKDQIPDFHYLYKVVKHLRDHPEYKTLVVEIVDECDESCILEYEQKWLTVCEGDDNCLNMGFIAKLSSGDTRKLNNIRDGIQDTYRANLVKDDNGLITFVPADDGRWFVSRYEKKKKFNSW